MSKDFPTCPICHEDVYFKSKVGEYHFFGCRAQCLRTLCDSESKEIKSYHLQMNIDNKDYQFNSQLAWTKGRKERSWLSIYKKQETDSIYTWKHMMEIDKYVSLTDIDDPEQFFRRLIKLRMFA